MRVLLFIAFLTLAAVPRSSLALEFPAEITVGSWNLEWFYDHEPSDNRSKLAKEKSAPSEKEWQWKLQSVADVIGKHRPYIMALQEVENRKVLFDLKNLLRSKYGLAYRIGYVEGFDTFTEQDVAVLFRDGLVEMSRKEQNTVQWKSKKFRNLSKHLITRFEWLENGQKENLVIFNLHLRAMPERENLRVQQALLAREWINEEIDRYKNVIVLGDLNTEHPVNQETKNSDIGTLRGLDDSSPLNDLHDSLASVARSARSTHMTGKAFDRILYSKTLSVDDPSRKDLVFRSASVEKKEVIRGKVDVGDQRWNNVYAIPQTERDVSDHYPLFAKFEFK